MSNTYNRFRHSLSDYQSIANMVTANDISLLNNVSGEEFFDFLSQEYKDSEDRMKWYPPFFIESNSTDYITDDILFLINHSQKITRNKFAFKNRGDSSISIISFDSFQLFQGFYLLFFSVGNNSGMSPKSYTMFVDFDDIENPNNMGFSYVPFPSNRWDQFIVERTIAEIQLFWEEEEAKEAHDEAHDDILEVIGDYTPLLVSANRWEDACRFISFMCRQSDAWRGFSTSSKMRYFSAHKPDLWI